MNSWIGTCLMNSRCRNFLLQMKKIPTAGVEPAATWLKARYSTTELRRLRSNAGYGASYATCLSFPPPTTFPISQVAHSILDPAYVTVGLDIRVTFSALTGLRTPAIA